MANPERNPSARWRVRTPFWLPWQPSPSPRPPASSGRRSSLSPADLRRLARYRWAAGGLHGLAKSFQLWFSTLNWRRPLTRPQGSAHWPPPR